VVELVAAGKAGGYQRLDVAAVLQEPLRDAQVSPDSISQNPSQKGT